MGKQTKIYSLGDVVKVNGSKYELVAETAKGCCKGCAFINRPDCDPVRTNVCRNGLIFNKISK